ncbi:MAG: hypothetical protein AAGF33_04215 [Pseudomonadota bacterium]
MIRQFVTGSVALCFVACSYFTSNAEGPGPQTNGQIPDFSTLEFALRAPTVYRLRNDGAPFKVTARNGLTGEIVEEELLLLRRSLDSSDFLQERELSGHTVALYGVDAADRERLQDFRRTLDDWRRESERQESKDEHSLSFSANALGSDTALGCLEGAADASNDLTLEIYMRTDPSVDFYALIDEQSLALPEGAEGYC